MFISLNLLLAHFVGDFLLQSDWMALNKSKHWDVLTIHAGVYSLCFIPWGPYFVALTFLLHWGVDFCTSRVTSKLWFMEIAQIDWPGEEQRVLYQLKYPSTRHWFFVAIGADQLIHYATLALTLRILS